MQKELVNLSDYKLNLSYLTPTSELTGMASRGILENTYHEFTYEYKQIAENRHNHNLMIDNETVSKTQNLPSSKINERVFFLNQSFLEKESRLVDICNMRFQTLLELGVFVKK